VPLSAELIHSFILLGIEGEKLAAVIELIERHVTSRDASRYEVQSKRKSAERSRRYRQRHATDRHVTNGKKVSILTSSSLLTDSPRTTKVERKKKKVLSALPNDWMPKEGHFDLAFRKYGKSPEWVNDLADVMRS